MICPSCKLPQHWSGWPKKPRCFRCNAPLIQKPKPAQSRGRP